MDLLRNTLGLAAASIVLSALAGCAASPVAVSTPTPPPTPPTSPTPTPEPNSCTTANTTSPAQSSPTPNYPGSAFSGKVLAGSLPMTGASVQLYAAGTTGDGLAPTPLLATPLITDATGAFSVPASFTCPYSNSVLYAVSTGGQPGGSGTVNPGAVLAGVLGSCASIVNDPSFTVNEATTVATATAMSQFLAPGGNIGASSTNSSGITLAAATAANLVNPATGAAPGAAFPGTGTAPTARIDSLANLLNACIVSSGGSSTACTQLYADTATSAGAPTNTLDAMLNLLRHPAANVAALYTLSDVSSAYTPTLDVAPTDWTIFAIYTGGGMSDPAAVAIDSLGNVWVTNYFYVASLFSNIGVPAFPTGIGGNDLDNSFGGAVDVNNTVWITNQQNPGGGLGSVTLLNSSGVSPNVIGSGGLDFPTAIAFDTSGNAWVADYGNSHVTLFNDSGTALSGASGYTADNLVFPVAIATDSDCNAYVANLSSDTVTRVTANGSTFTNFVTGIGPSGLAVDSADNIWVANYYGDSIGLVSAAGSVLSGGGFTGGGVTQPQGVAIDGAGNVWIANYRSAASNLGAPITELAGTSSANPGAALSPAGGFGTDANMVESFGIAIDAAGNLWVSNFGSNALTEFVGIAAPVKTPLLGPVRVP